MTAEEKEAYIKRYYADRDNEDKKWGFDRLFGKISGRCTVHIVGIAMAIQFLSGFLIMGVWPGYATYIWILTFLPMSCYLILRMNDALETPRFEIDGSDNEHGTDEIMEINRERGFAVRKALAYVYLSCVFVSFMFAIFGSWGMGQEFWGRHCMLPRGCDRDHWIFIILTVIRLFIQFHVFWVLLCHSDKLKARIALPKPEPIQV
jgi:hypothetical protein